MRAIATVLVPWLAWGALDAGVYTALTNLSPASFADSGAPATVAMAAILVALRAVYSIVAGWVAAKIGGERQRAILAAIGFLLLTGIIAQSLQWSVYPVWYHVVFVVSIVPCAWFGTQLAGRPQTATYRTV